MTRVLPLFNNCWSFKNPCMIRSSCVVAALAVLMLETGCVRRSLTIRTDPPGAFVHVNDEPKGESPVEYDFMWYGWHRVTIRKEGFERLDDKKRLRPPFYLWIPFDLIMEALPFTVRDRREWVYTLTPQQVEQSVLGSDEEAASETQEHEK